jgi:hypothetical protein
VQGGGISLFGAELPICCIGCQIAEDAFHQILALAGDRGLLQFIELVRNQVFILFDRQAAVAAVADIAVGAPGIRPLQRRQLAAALLWAIVALGLEAL